MAKRPFKLPARLPELPLYPARSLTTVDELTAAINTIIDQKMNEALSIWALQKMGKNAASYVQQAHGNYFALIELAKGLMDWNEFEVKADGSAEESRAKLLGALLDVYERAPMAIPLKLRQKSSPFAVNPFTLREKYSALLPEIQSIKSKTRHNPSAQKMALAEALGVTEQKRIGKYIDMKASDVVLDHILHEHNPGVGKESMKKLLALATHPKSLYDRIIADIARRSGVRPPVKASSTIDPS